MDLLSRGFNAVLGGERGKEGEREESTAGVVEKLCHRLTTSILIQDRRDAMRALRCVCCLFVYLFTCLFVYLFVCLFTSSFVCLFVCLFTCSFVYLFTYLCVDLSPSQRRVTV